MCAARHGHTPLVEYLLSLGVDARAKNLIGQTALDLAQQHKHTVIVESLKLFEFLDAAESATVELVSSMLHTQTKKHATLSKFLEELKREPVPFFDEDEIAYFSRSCESLAPWTINTADPLTQRTALSRAAQKGRESVAGFLISQGASMDLGDVDGNTPLHHAAQNGHLFVCQLIVMQHGGNPQPRNKAGQSPADLAEGQHKPVFDFLTEPLQFLAAAEKGEIATLTELMNRPSCETWTINFLSHPQRETALMLASRSGHVAVVCKLVDQGADASLTSKDGQSALDLSVAGNHPRVAVALLLALSQPIDADAPVHAVLDGHFSCAQHRHDLLGYLRSSFFTLLLRIERSDPSLVAIDVRGRMEGMPDSPDDAIAQLCAALRENNNAQLQTITLAGLHCGSEGEKVLAEWLSSDKPPRVGALNLSGNQLSCEHLFTALPSSLNSLVLANNPIANLPESLVSLQSLKTLDLRGTQIKYVPLELRTLPLESLSLPESCAAGNGGNIPRESMGSDGAIAYLRTFATFLVSCRTETAVVVDLQNLQNAPSDPDDLCDVLRLELAKNTGLSSLKLAKCELKASAQLDALLACLGGCTDLDLSENPLGACPDFSPLKNVQTLNLRNCGLRSLSETLFRLPALKRLDLSSNQAPTLVWTSPPGSGLQKMLLANCGLECFPEFVLQLPSLEDLDLHGNPLSGNRFDLNAVAAPVAPLKVLNLASCGLKKLPSVVFRLVTLADLDLSENPLKVVPLTLATRLPVLRVLKTVGCTALEPYPPGVLAGKTPQDALAVLRTSESKPRAMLLFLGFGGVGKSALADALFPVVSSVENVGAEGVAVAAQAQIINGATLSLRMGSGGHQPVIGDAFLQSRPTR
eukprot:TRINITY_DN5445_c1_g2_i1.p1 TRINITY_DN5445_c1_g2~~TRINITY_DN5445_c1_g2_i1.p1  ORF type:complete len:867 (-),score=162.05 TRINITY_DN5445_c1_g2_i1:1509-4109(-)